MNESTTSSAIKLEIRYLASVNYAVHHNGYPVCERCELVNTGDADVTDVAVKLTGPMVDDCQVHLDVVPAMSTVRVDGLDIRPDADRLLGLTEGVTTTFTVEVTVGGQPEVSQTHELRLLPVEQWLGSALMPELLAAYVTPNASAVSTICRLAAEHLMALTGDPSLDGYQTQDPNRVRAMVAAIYKALRELGIVYSNPPADFEVHGQRVRLAQQVVEQKMATCLDTALLMASCLESCGLHPVLVLVTGHAMVGAWLVNDHCTNMASDDMAYLTKRCVEGVDEMVLVESTMVTVTGNPTFEEAVQSALDTLRSPEVELTCFIDVKACRLQHVRPIPLGREQVENEGLEHAVDSDGVREVKMVDMSDLATRADITRQQIWERKLLDFSMRNNLLNVRVGRRVIQFVSFAIDALEDSISDGHDFEVMPALDEAMKYAGNAIVDSMQFRANAQAAVVDALKHHRMVAYLDEAELTERLKYIYRTSRTAMEENGSNSLFLSLGVLKWYESDRSTRPRYAPIVMVPMQIVRHKANKYVLRARDEETIINVTLLEMIRQQFNVELPLLDPLPTDEHGVDVMRILAIVRQSVKDMPRWNVLDEVLLGLFSFNKFVMWKDIRQGGDHMASHPFIAGLLSNTAPAELVAPADGGPDEAADLDAAYAPTELALPVDIDSSQLEAVLDSHRGRSFVLHGPPGTGKSQTITNIIANALFHGKRVLFVAAKMAALEVVQKRLEAIGLAPFCLEMHSNKSTKAHFLNQLQSAFDVTRYASPSQYETVAKQLRKERNALNAYIDELYKPRPSGFTLHDCIEGYLASGDDTPVVKLASATVEALTPERLDQQLDSVRRLDTVVRLNGAIAGHPLRGLRLDADTVTRLPEIHDRLGQAVEAIGHLQAGIQFMTSLLGVAPPCSHHGAAVLASTIEALRGVAKVTPVLLVLARNKEQTDALGALVEVGRRRDADRDELTRMYGASVLQLDAADVRTRWQEVEDRWWLPRFFAKRRFMKQMKAYSPTVEAAQIPDLIARLESYHSAEATVQGGGQQLHDHFGPMASPGAERWDDIDALLAEAHALGQAMAAYCGAVGQPVEAQLDQLDRLVAQAGAIDLQAHRARMSEVAAHAKRAAEAIEQLDQVLSANGDTALRYAQEPDMCKWIPDFERWLPAIEPLGGSWYHWCRAYDELRAQGLAVVADLVASGTSAADAARSLAKSAYKALADAIIVLSVDLQAFDGMIFEDKIARFRELDAKHQQLTKQMLYCQLAAQVPVGSAAVAHGSEVGIVRRNIANGGRGTSIRSIIDQIPTLLPKLCPCMLMSPLSVAQFIDMASPAFDLVIFDEASQLPTSEAVGTIARGKAVVVVGDPKQMPPTSFFNVSQVDEDEADVDDLDSILDDAIALSLPSRHLTWHYRSKHESLIAFSNAQYYDGRLFTFPSVDDRVSRVSYVPIEGTYDKGHSRCNQAEAEAIVAELVRRIEAGTHSVGVVAFSIAQQNLIEDKLLEVFEQRPSLEAKAYDVPEPVFIKNLENVQGDERDVILFSVGYGPDAKGRVSMNFGPLNRQGGERRLNVAVSRARYEMVVFATLKPEQIDLNRSKARGVADLRQFLEYARDGRLVLDPGQLQEGRSAMTADVAEALTNAGYSVKTGVGRSRFKIDVAVMDPRDPSRYLLAIVGDGPGYHEAKTARDREICRPSMLAALGWTVARVWTLDWYRRRDDVIARLLALLDKLAGEPIQPASAPGANKPGPKANHSDGYRRNAAAQRRRDAEQPVLDLFRGSRIIKNAAEGEVEQAPYTAFAYEPKSMYFNEGINRKKEKEALQGIVATEQPVTESRVQAIMQDIWKIYYPADLRRAAGVVSRMLRTSGFYLDPMSLPDNGTFWLSAADAERLGEGYRQGGGRRNTDIPVVEVAAAIKAVLRREVSMPMGELYKRITTLFGFARRTVKITAVVDRAVECLEQQAAIVVSGNSIRLA